MRQVRPFADVADRALHRRRAARAVRPLQGRERGPHRPAQLEGRLHVAEAGVMDIERAIRAAQERLHRQIGQWARVAHRRVRERAAKARQSMGVGK